MKNFIENEGILVGAKVHPQIAENFKKLCRQERYNQRLFFSNLLEWFLSLDSTNQEHIYRGRMSEVFAFEDEAAAARDSAKNRRKKRQRPSIAG